MTPSSPIILNSDRLSVEIARPGALYAGTRFDWSGFITQVTLDGRHTFCVPEDYRPGQGTGGIGLCNEFGIDMPVGFEGTQPGDLFPKLGIGLLTRLDKPDYSFWYPHKVAQPFPIEVEASTSSVTFTVQPLECRGYAARLVKTISVSGNRLAIQYRLENTGSQPITTNEYVHNFVGIDRQPIGPAYGFAFLQEVAYEPGMMHNVEVLAPDGCDLTFRRDLEAPFYVRLANLAASRQPQWVLVHRPSGVTISETVDFAPSRLALWGTAHVISAEVFHDIHLQPGQTDAWRREYEFYG